MLNIVSYGAKELELPGIFHNWKSETVAIIEIHNGKLIDVKYTRMKFLRGIDQIEDFYVYLNKKEGEYLKNNDLYTGEITAALYFLDKIKSFIYENT